MLRLVQVGNSLPASFICDPSAEFQPGQVAELTVIGNQVMATVSNGTAPIGIIDDIKTVYNVSSFYIPRKKNTYNRSSMYIDALDRKSVV